MANLFDWKAGKYNALMGKLGERLTPEQGDLLLADATLIDKMVAVLAVSEGVLQSVVNPFALPVGELLARLERANAAQGWNLGEAVFHNLRATVPVVPEGRLVFLTLRIRFGTGQKGVEETFEAHAAEIQRMHGVKKFWRWEYLRSDKKHLRLLVGNETHVPIVEWCVIDLGANRNRQSITAVRGPNSLADDGLVLAWLYPEYVRAIDDKENPGFFLAGYELNVPEHGDEPWQHVPIVYRYLDAGRVKLSAYWHSYAFSDYSAPLRRV